MEYENSEMTEKDLYKLDKRLDLDNKSLALCKIGYTLIDAPQTRYGDYIILNEKSVTEILSLENIRNMERYEQISNPAAIAGFAANHEIDPCNVLHEPKAFEDWLFTRDSIEQLPDVIQKELHIPLGEKFSLKNRKAEMKKREKQTQQNDLDDQHEYFEQEYDLIADDDGYHFVEINEHLTIDERQ